MSKKLLSHLNEPQTINLLKQRASVQTDEHQLEFVTQVRGVGYVNDSKSIRVSETKNALEQIDAPVVLIVGGNDKESDYSVLAKQVSQKVTAIIYLGEESSHILQHYSTANLLFAKAVNIEEAVKMAYYFARPDDVVLFSPACDHSFDYKVLGYRFKKGVNSLITISKKTERKFF